MLCGDLSGKEIQKRRYIYIYIWLIHFAVQQKHNIVKQQEKLILKRCDEHTKGNSETRVINFMI